ncbi:hypothetical protein ACF0H5_004837 [Mactra antiquata]
MMMKKYISFVLLFFIESVVNNVTFICGVDQLCSDDQEFSHILSGECKPCFCHGNCAPNTICPTSDIVDANLEECRHQLSFFNLSDIKVDDLPEYLQLSYYVVLKCPPDTDSKLKAECESTDNPTDNHYVSSVSTYRIYKNKNCARCNGEDSFVEWRSVVGLSENETENLRQGYYDETNLTNLMKAKPALSVSPIGYPNLTNICDSPPLGLFIKGTCDEIEKGKVFDENIIQLCGSSKFPVVQHSIWAYRNAYCFACNHDISTNSCSTKDNLRNVPILIPKMHRLLYLEQDVLQNVIDLRDHRYTCRNSQIVDPLKVSHSFYYH